jgi:uncharacterized protein
VVEVGSTNQLTVVRRTKPGHVLRDDEGREVLLPHKLGPSDLKVGDTISVFVYTDSEDRPVATTQKPLAQVGDFACLKVVHVNDHGAFLDWGLDKDLFVPRSEQHIPMRVGQSYVVAVFLDGVTERVAAASRLGPFFDYDVSGIAVGKAVDLLVYDENEVGTLVIVDDRYSGMIHRSELFQQLRIGDRLPGFVANVREDNKLDIRLRRTGQGGQQDASTTILEALHAAGGTLSLGDKSPPEEIAERLGLSKKAFKAAVGALYKSGQVVPGPTETKFVPAAQGKLPPKS